MREYHVPWRETLATEVMAAQLESNRQESTRDAIAAGCASGHLTLELDDPDIDLDADANFWRYFT